VPEKTDTHNIFKINSGYPIKLICLIFPLNINKNIDHMADLLPVIFLLFCFTLFDCCCCWYAHKQNQQLSLDSASRDTLCGTLATIFWLLWPDMFEPHTKNENPILLGCSPTYPECKTTPDDRAWRDVYLMDVLDDWKLKFVGFCMICCCPCSRYHKSAAACSKQKHRNRAPNGIVSHSTYS